MKYLLSIDTCFANGSLGIYEIKKSNFKVLEYKTWKSERVKKSVESFSHSDYLPKLAFDTLDQVGLKPQDLNMISVTVGPGRFTGIRVGINTAKTLSFGLKIPCYPVDTLTVAAQQIKADRFVIAYQAFRNSVYMAEFYENHLTDPQFMTIEDFWKKISEYEICVGDMDQFYQIPENLKLRFQTAYPSAQLMTDFLSKNFNINNFQPWFKLKPLYIRDNLS